MYNTDPTWPKYSPPYTFNNIPTPPPPPRERNKKLYKALVISVFALGLSIAGNIFGVVRFYQATEVSPTATIRRTPTSIPTTYIDATYYQELSADDFSTFMDGFRQAVTKHDWAALAANINSGDFSEYCVMAATSCKNDWKTTYSQLSKYELELFIFPSYKHETPPSDGGLCGSYIHIAAQWIFVLASYSQTLPATLAVPLAESAIFGFYKDSAGDPWTWDILLLNMQSCSNP